MQCGKGKSYTPCMSTCPMKTCDNLSKQKHQTQLCNEEPCVEGCSPDTCSKDSVYEDDVDFKVCLIWFSGTGIIGFTHVSVCSLF